LDHETGKIRCIQMDAAGSDRRRRPAVRKLRCPSLNPCRSPDPCSYAVAGVKEYYILDPEDRYMHFYRLTAGRHYADIQPDAAGIIRSSVLPGFRFRRADLLKQPPLAELALDEIYANYLFPGYLASVNRIAAATAARKQAEDDKRALQAELARLHQRSS